jgi:hypothetical protein
VSPKSWSPQCGIREDGKSKCSQQGPQRCDLWGHGPLCRADSLGELARAVLLSLGPGWARCPRDSPVSLKQWFPFKLS